MSRARGVAAIALGLFTACFCPSDAGAGNVVYVKRDLTTHVFLTPPDGYACWNTTGATWEQLFQSGAPIPCYPMGGDRPTAR